MSFSNSQVIAAQMEKVNPKLQELVETTTTLYKYFQRTPSHVISAWTQALNGGGSLNAFRIPVLDSRGGDFGTFNYDGGDLGDGTAMTTNFMTIGYFPTKIGYSITALAAEATAKSEQSVISAFRYALTNLVKEFQVYHNIVLHTAGDGILATGGGTGSPAGSNPTYNLEPNFGAQRLRRGMPVDVYSNDGTTQRGTGLRVASYDLVNKTVSLTGTVTSPTNTDNIAFAGMSAPIAVGSFQNGLRTFQNNATSGSLLGLSRVTETELTTPSVNANSAGLAPEHLLILRDQIIGRRDESQLAGIMGLTHMSQRTAWFKLGLSISEWQRGANDKMIDLMPSDTGYETTVNMCGVKHVISKSQDRSRIDWFNPKKFGRVLLHEAKFFEVEGRRIFEYRNATTANPAAGMKFYMIGAENLFSTDPGAAGYVYSLAIPTGY